MKWINNNQYFTPNPWSSRFSSRFFLSSWQITSTLTSLPAFNLQRNLQIISIRNSIERCCIVLCELISSLLLIVLLQIFINAKIRRSGFCVILPLNWTLTFCAKLPMCDSSDRGTGSQARLRSPLLATLATLGFRRPDQETRTGQELASDGTRRWSGPGTRSSCCQLSLDTVTHCAVRAGVTVLCGPGDTHMERVWGI